jgi:mRNA degradation ribonuclease J1/J2
MAESDVLVDDAIGVVGDALRSSNRFPLQEDYINGRVREALGSFLFKQTGRRPMIVTLLLDM